MQDERSCADVEKESDRFEAIVLGLLLDSGARGPWSMEEIGREIGNPLRATDAVLGLHASGLVHRCREFVFLTRPAARFNQLAGGA